MTRTFRLLLCGLAFIPHILNAQPGPNPQTVTLSDAQRTGRTGTMVELLKEIAEKLPTSYKNAFANTARVKYYTETVKTNPSDEMALYREMLLSGMNDKAVEGFEKMLARPGLTSEERWILRMMLGISHMRQGEQDNCITNHTAQSCLFPIEKGGVHTIQRGSRAAIEDYSAVLREHPDDARALWLLNVAYMTLGEYPAKVPAQWLIPEKSFRSDYDLPRFTDIAPQVGLDLPTLSGGCCVEDFDNDGDMDIMTSNWDMRGQDQYFENNGDGTFTERTNEAGLKGIIGGLNMVHADYNNDGYADVYILRGAWLGPFGNQPNSLLRNNGNGTFTDVTIESGMLTFHPDLSAAWGDFDNDGWLDLYVGNETSSQLAPCELFRNNHDGTFTDVAHEVGLDIQGFVKAVAWGDYNNDGLIDLYISSHGSANRLMRNNGNKNGKWSFTDVGLEAGVREPIYSFPAFFFDYDNDGWLDIFVSDYGGKPTGAANEAPITNVLGPLVNDYLGHPPIAEVPRLYRNNRNGTFTDVGAKVHLNKTLVAMGCNFGDLDNDGFLDIYAGTGNPDLNTLIPNRMFRNAGGKVFQDVTTAGGFGHLQKGHGIAFADVDNDGDQDVFEVMGGAFETDLARRVLFRNPGNRNHWITLMLEGVKANRCAIGARIKIMVRGRSGKPCNIYATVGTGGSFGSSSLQQEIGLGDARGICSITIDWPGSHTRQVLTKVEMDRVVKIREGDKGVTLVERTPIQMPRADAPAMQEHHHHDHMHD